MNSNKNNGVIIKRGVPFIWGIQCMYDQNYKYSLVEYLGLSSWMCPFCNTNLNEVNGNLYCINGCHSRKGSSR